MKSKTLLVLSRNSPAQRSLARRDWREFLNGWKASLALCGLLSFLLALGALLLTAQEAVIHVVGGGNQLKLAIPDFLGAGDAAKFMQVFNDTLWNEVDNGGVVTLVGKSVYPLMVPQRPDDFVPPAGRSKLNDWSDPPVRANDLAFGYAASQNGQFVLIGNLYNLSTANPAQAGLFSNKRYQGPLDENGVRSVARQYAADILAQFGGKSLAGTKIFFVSDRSVPARKQLDGTIISVDEIWWMDYDGSNQRQLTFYKSISKEPAVSADGKMFAFVSYPQKTLANGMVLDGNPQIMIHSVEPDRSLQFYNPVSSIVSSPEFTPDGKHLLFSTHVGTRIDPNIYMSNLQGGDLTAISHAAAPEVEPKVNPKTGTEVVFISGRTGHPQLWEMNIDGSGPHMLTDGTGEAANPSWSPDGRFVAFSWTRGFTYGEYNIFIMDMATHRLDQLTHDTGDNENPTWAPDGLHLVYSSKKGRVTQIFSMLANGLHVNQLTTKGNNFEPVWTKGID